eukprot:Skav206398  [mRNA]  locus=scaffold690:164152:167774:+ [translate_table: standard]
MDGGQTRGYVRKTVVVRSIATVGNYDYIMDVKFREDGEINVETRFAGYPECFGCSASTRYPGQGEEVFSTMVRDGVAGIVHTHSVAWKADIEVVGRAAGLFQSVQSYKDWWVVTGGAKNALHVTEVREHNSSGHWAARAAEGVRLPRLILEREMGGLGVNWKADANEQRDLVAPLERGSSSLGPPWGYGWLWMAMDIYVLRGNKCMTNI